MFWAGPMSGAIIAALVYELTLRPSHDPVRLAPLSSRAAAQGAGVHLYGFSVSDVGSARLCQPQVSAGAGCTGIKGLV